MDAWPGNEKNSDSKAVNSKRNFKLAISSSA